MAGERYARLRISFTNEPKGSSFTITLNGTRQTFTDGVHFYSSGTGSAFNQPNTAESVAVAIIIRLQDLGWRNLYTVETYEWLLNIGGNPSTFKGIQIKANTFDSALNFQPSSFNNLNGANFFEELHENTVNPLQITTNVVKATCFGSSTGSIIVSVAGAVGSVSYAWSDGAVTKDRFNLPAGIYRVTAVDSQGTTAEATAEITQNPVIAVTGSVGNNQITLEVSGGVAPYTFLWNDGATVQNRTGVDGGIYTVVVTDSIGCSRSFTFTQEEERFCFSQNPVYLELQADNLQSKPNLSFLCEVWVEPVYLSGIFKQVAVLEHPADSEGKTTFDVKEFLQPFLQHHLPEPGQMGPTMAEGAFKRFYLKHTEKYGLVPVPGEVTVKENRYVVQGGLSFEEFASDTFFTTYLLQRKPFFSWQPALKKVRENQPEYLYFMPNYFDITSFSLRVRYYYADGTYATATSYTQAGVRRFELYCLPVGFLQLQLQGEKQVLKYEVWVEDQNSRILTETRTYELTRAFDQVCRYFIYNNSLGGVDTLAATALADEELEISSESIDRVLLSGYKAADGDRSVIRKAARPSLKLSSGYLSSQQELDALTDFVLSCNVKLLENGRYRAGEVVLKNFNRKREDEPRHYLDFEFEMAAFHSYTPPLQ
ncbi:SprB repeat-containing protein [Pontibacter sp. SGAir0037]|uniref:SprB repeat-containing protein n=1 Tax=Pontibacter sp. SGAir0037 TaxID=2571030 RepID=UPI0010CD1059|nr:SprB repeat-containing protein [Pontibacter sp. SGAir0037]QCR23069.1 hypothetical protein C1N53_12425 [Pontibacter sp. SGAir0037]